MTSKKYPSRAQYRQEHNIKPPKKAFYKKWWFWLIIIILIVGGVLIGTFGDFYTPKKTETTTTQTSKKKTAKKAVKKSTKEITGVSLKQYNGIYLSEKDGLSSEILTEYFGKPNESSVSKVDDLQTNVDTWEKVANGTKNSKVIVHFYNDHAVTKAISDLKVTRNEKITLKKYQELQNGQTSNDVLNTLGNPNTYSESMINGTATKVFKYTTGLNGDQGAEITVTFNNDAVDGKNQTGLK